MVKVAEIEIRKIENPFYFKVDTDIELKTYDYCIVENNNGNQDYGRFFKFYDYNKIPKENIIGKVLRKATTEDIIKIQENILKKEEIAKICLPKIKEHNLPLKLIDVEYSFDRSKITIYYWAEGRIDFRNLVKDLAGIFNCRIEMKQIGLRDEARLKGGYGICGRCICCSQFLKNFESITMSMVKNQKLPLDMNKITGLCGRLLCCLAFEEPFYTKEEKK